MSTGIWVAGAELVMRDIAFEGVEVGVEYNGSSLDMEDVNFRATKIGVKGKKIGSITMNRVSHDEIGWRMRLTPIAAAVRREINGIN